MSCCGPFVPKLPSFNLFFKHFWDGDAHAGSPGDPGDVEDFCQLVVPHGPEAFNITTLGAFQAFFPALLDIRFLNQDPAAPNPAIEIPLGSGRWYLVVLVDDVHKGFPNEYRIAYLNKGFPSIETFPVPLP